MSDIPEFKVLSSWNNDDVKFSFVFMIEFLPKNMSIKHFNHVYNNVSGEYKVKKNQFVEYLNKYGNEGEDWMISKHRGSYHFGAAIMVGFSDKYNAMAFMLENS
jgi:hypothetical protein